MKQLYDDVAIRCSKLTTKSYSTSFSLGIRLLDKRFQSPIYAVYGFVRFADEIVDTFHDYDKAELLAEFRRDTWLAIERGISMNPILNSFQQVVNQFSIDRDLIEAFLDSMEMDLDEVSFDRANYERYILGSAEVVGLMCLKIFVEGNQERYDELKFGAMRLGSAFQKINFLRDIKADYEGMGRMYFPECDLMCFDEQMKVCIEKEIEKDFRDGFEGILALPKGARFGVYLAYVYYHALFKKIRRTPSHRIMKERIRIPNQRKYAIMLGSYLRHSFNAL